MIYLYWWLAIGVVTFLLVLLNHFLTRDKKSDSSYELIEAANPDRKKVSYRIENSIVVPTLGAIFFVVAWPVAFYMKARDLYQDRNNTEREFAVKKTHLIGRLTLEEVEQSEIVTDPLGAVPMLPFGHLNGAWVKFVNDLPAGAEVWSFSAQSEMQWGQKEIHEGYVAVHNGKPGAYFSTLRKQIDDDA